MQGIRLRKALLFILSSLLSGVFCQIYGEISSGIPERLRIEEIRSFARGYMQNGNERIFSTPVYGTAGDWYSMAYDHAISWSSDVVPVAIFNTDTLEIDGVCRGWGYSFHSESLDSVLYVQIMDAEVQFDQSQPPLFSTPISGTWIDSDDVLPLVEGSGGSVYRQSNTGVLMQAFLAGQLYDSCISNSYFWTVGYTSESSSELDFFVKGTQPVLYGYHSDCQGDLMGAALVYQYVEQKSLEWAGDAGLFSIASLGTIDETGKSSAWSFEFISYDRGKKRLYHACDDSIFTNRSTGVIGGWRPMVSYGGWIDSEEAVAAAEANGGSDFRNEHPLTSASAAMRRSVVLPFNEHLWTVEYDDLYGEKLSVLIGAESGGFKGSFNTNRNLDSLFTSNQYLSEAQAAASTWSGDASMFGIVSVKPLSFPRKGSSTAWGYLYHSSQRNESISVTVQLTTGSPRIAIETFSDPWQTGEITEGWLDSDSVLIITGGAGGDGVGGGIEEPSVESIMAKGLFPEQPARTVWLVQYHSSCQAGTFYLDAYTGEILDGGVGIQDELPPHLPESVELLQNYPNPFNPSTVIRFSVRELEGANVTLKIYDLHGRLVRTLVDGMKAKGNHVIQWDGRNDRGIRASSGIYLMRLNAGSTSSVRKMILIK